MRIVPFMIGQRVDHFKFPRACEIDLYLHGRENLRVRRECSSEIGDELVQSTGLAPAAKPKKHVLVGIQCRRVHLRERDETFPGGLKCQKSVGFRAGQLIRIENSPIEFASDA